jgi:hypothetical protein
MAAAQLTCPLCVAPSIRKPLRSVRTDRRALTERGVDLSDRRVVENAIQNSTPTSSCIDCRRERAGPIHRS